MRSLARILLTALLIFSLVEAPLHARAVNALGVVLQADHAHLGALPLAAGSTVFPGDVLSTSGEGAIRVRVGQAQLYLLENSAAMLTETSRFRAQIQRGTVGFATAGQPLELVTGEWIVRPRGAERTHGQVTLVNASELVVSSYRGDVEVTAGAESFTVTAGNTYRLMLGQQDPQGEGASDASRNRLIILWLSVAAVAAGVAVLIWRATLSPDSPQ